MKIFGIISLTLFTLGYIPQIYKLAKSKHADGISVPLWIMLILGHVTGFIYVSHINDKILMLVYGFGFIASAIVLAQIYSKRC